MTRKLVEFGIAHSNERYSAHSVWNRFATSWQYTLFVELCKQAYSFIPDGETTAGHQKFRQPSPEEAVNTASKMVDLILAESARRGYLVEQPSWDDMREQTPEFPKFNQVNGAERNK